MIHYGHSWFLGLLPHSQNSRNEKTMKLKTNLRIMNVASLLCFLLLFFCLGRERDQRRRFATLFPCLPFLVRFAPCWARILLDNSSLFFLTTRVILLIFLIASFAYYILEINSCHFLTSAQWVCQKLKQEVGSRWSTFTLPWRWENAAYDWNRDFMK